ncbi:hypothetical protein ACVWU4_000975 [Campylobacter coli]
MAVVTRHVDGKYIVTITDIEESKKVEELLFKYADYCKEERSDNIKENIEKANNYLRNVLDIMMSDLLYPVVCEYKRDAYSIIMYYNKLLERNSLERYEKNNILSGIESLRVDLIAMLVSILNKDEAVVSRTMECIKMLYNIVWLLDPKYLSKLELTTAYYNPNAVTNVIDTEVIENKE